MTDTPDTSLAAAEHYAITEAVEQTAHDMQRDEARAEVERLHAESQRLRNEMAVTTEWLRDRQQAARATQGRDEARAADTGTETDHG